MKITIFFVVCVIAYVGAADIIPIPPPPPSEVSQEGILNNIGKAAKEGLYELIRDVRDKVIHVVKDALTDGLQLSPTKEVSEALHAFPSTEGIFEATSDLILKKAFELVAEHEQEQGVPSHEGISQNLGYIYKIHEAENYVNAQYNKTLIYPGPSHEGILGGLGGFVLKGFGNLLGGNFGNVIKTAGDVVGNLFFVVPKFPISANGIVPEQPSTEGIISSAGNIISKGTGKLAGQILKGVFDVIPNIFGNIFLAKGHYSNYTHIRGPGYEIILNARKRIHGHNHTAAEFCVQEAEKNFTALLKDYVKNGDDCVATGSTHGKRILGQVQDLVLDAVRRVEDAHRETAYCFNKHVEENKITCLDKYIPEKIAKHRDQILKYGVHLSNFVKEFSDINGQFDICLARYLGSVRREIYNIIYNFHKCLALHPTVKKQLA